MANAIMGRHEAADCFRRIADEIEWGNSHSESPGAIAAAVMQALGRIQDWAISPDEDPYESFAVSFAGQRESCPIARLYREQAVTCRDEEGLYAASDERGHGRDAE
jgi:hypothetical protein